MSDPNHAHRTHHALHELVDVDRVIARTVEMVRIPSVNPFEREPADGEGESEVATWLERQLDALGWETGQHEVAASRPNQWALSPGGDGPTLALGGHLDTVGIEGYDGDPFSGRINDGRIFGRGTCDMKGAFACFLEVAEVLKAAEVELSGRLLIAGLADEEAAMMGSTQYGEHGPQPDMAIIGEPTELAICTAHLGQYAVPIRTAGRAVHSSIASEGVNAIEQMMEVMAALKSYGAELAARPGHAMCGPGSVNAGVIHGGNMVSIVPDWCELHVDRRVAPGDSGAQAAREIQAILDELAAADAEFSGQMGEPMVNSSPLDTPQDSPVVMAAQDAARRHGVASAAVAFPAATDAPNLGVPAIIWGPGSLDQAHTIDEWVSIDQLEHATHLYLDAVLGLLS